MFDVKCPHCNKKIGLYQRKALLLHDCCPCIYCNRQFKVRDKSRWHNACFIGGFLGIYMKIFHNASIVVIAMTALFFGFFLQRIIDIFYSLESAEEDVYW